MSLNVISLLEELRVAERAQTRFYRALAAEAERMGNEDLSERLNALHADEQHHLSRLSARVLELGRVVGDSSSAVYDPPALDEWESVALRLEQAEIDRYRAALEIDLDPASRSLIQEILESEIHHARELGGKWMSA